MEIQGIKGITRRLDPSNLNQEQLWNLRRNVPLGSIYLSDYDNSYNIDNTDCSDFFDDYLEDIYQRAEELYPQGSELNLEAWMDANWSRLDNPEELHNFYCSYDDPFNTNTKLLSEDQIVFDDRAEVQDIMNQYRDDLTYDDDVDQDDIQRSLNNPHVTAIRTDDGGWELSDAWIDYGYFTDDDIKRIQEIGDEGNLGESVDQEAKLNLNESWTSEYAENELDWQFTENDYFGDRFEIDDTVDFWENYLTDEERAEISNYVGSWMDGSDSMWDVINETFYDALSDCDLLMNKVEAYKNGVQTVSLGEAMEPLKESSEILWGTGNARDYLRDLSEKELRAELKNIGYDNSDIDGKTPEELINMVSSDEYIDEIDEEDFYEEIQPMIEKQTYKNIVLMSGTVGRYDGDIEGGKAVEAHELYDGKWDISKIEILEDDEGHLVWRGYHHDGTHRMHLYAVPTDEEELKKFVTELGLDAVESKWYGYDKEEAIDMAIEDLSATFLNDAVEDWSKIREVCKPLINGLRTETI